MIEVEDIRKEIEFVKNYGPVCHHVEKSRVLKKAKELWGDNFKIGYVGEWFKGNVLNRWVAVEIKESVSLERECENGD